MTDRTERFGGIARLYGASKLDRLADTHIMVIGIGGVGSWTAESLARSGVGTISLVDLDEVCVTNINRQLHAIDGTVGRPKVGAMADRIRTIAPDCTVHAVEEFFAPDTADEILGAAPDAVVDAIDHVGNKCLLLASCRERGIASVTTGGAGGRRNPARIQIGDLNRSEGDRLLRKIRKELRTRHGFPRGDRKWGIPCVYSDEPQRFPGADGEVCEVRDDATPLRLDCRTGFGTASFITGTFGLWAASLAIDLALDAKDR